MDKSVLSTTIEYNIYFMHRSPYLQAICWFILSLVVSCCNDAITKYLGNSFHAWQVIFCRFGFGVLTLLPVMLFQGKKAFITHRWFLHVVRGVLVFQAINLWSHGVQYFPLTTATLMSFTVPIFVLILAAIWLKEHVTWPMWIATLGGFIGVILVLGPHKSTYSFNPHSLFFLVAAILFGLLDVLNKKYVTTEPMLPMLFYASVVALVLCIYPVMKVWRVPSPRDWIWLLMLGVGSNLILYFLLRAFSLAAASSLAPFRYLELIISMLVGYVAFHEWPTFYSYLGAAIIIPCTLFIGYYQTRS